MPRPEIEIGGKKLHDFRLKTGEYVNFRSQGPNPDNALKDGYEPVSGDPRVGLRIQGTFFDLIFHENFYENLISKT